MTLCPTGSGTHTAAPPAGSVRRRPTLPAEELVRRRRRLSSEDRVAARSFSCLELVDLAPMRRQPRLVDRLPCRSHEFLEPRITASPPDHHAPIRRRPDDGPRDWRLPCERSEPIPH